MYAKINLVVQAKFKSNYGLALYENCIRYQGLPHTKWFKLETFKKLMGVPEDTYQIFRDFKRRVLDKALEEVNAYSDLFVLPEIERSGHKVISIRFKLSIREKKKWLGINLVGDNEKGEGSDPISNELTQKLTRQFFLDEKKSRKLIEEHGINYIEEKIKFVESGKAYADGSINNLGGYLLDAIKKDYKIQNVADQIGEKNKINYESQMLNNKLKEKKDSHENQYYNYVFTENEKVFSSLSEEKKIYLIKEYEKYLSKYGTYVSRMKYKNYGLDNRESKVFFYLFLREHHVDILPAVMSFKEFCVSTQ
jgi:hypothetical protein